MKRLLPFLSFLLFVSIIAGTTVLWAAQKDSSGLEPYVENLSTVNQGMTVWELIKTGGVFTIILALLSVAMIACVIYNFTLLKKDVLIPQTLADNIIHNIKNRNFKVVKTLCQGSDSPVAVVTLAGIDRVGKGPIPIREAMESKSREVAGNMWQGLGLLSDIAVISPMVGLLGTVVGMIQAFNVIAFQSAVVKPIMLAGGVSKAMVTTAGGLVVAIPAMLFYSFFKNRLTAILHTAEYVLSDISALLTENES